MGTHTELIAALAACRGTGRWNDIAKAAGLSYFTLSRIARGDIADPGIRTCEKLFAAIKATASAIPLAEGAQH